MSKVLSGDAVAAFERWALPEVSPAGPGQKAAADDQRYLRADQIEKIQKQAYEEAYAHGYQEGVSAGQAQAKAQAQRLAQLLNKLNGVLGETDRAVEQELSAFVLSIARLVLRRELSLGGDYIESLVREALALLPLSCRNVRVLLHPDDAALLRQQALGNGPETGWRIVEDPSLARGDCRIVSDSSRIDATLEQRLAAIEQALFAGRDTRRG